MARPRKEPERDIVEIMESIITPLSLSYLNPEGEKDINGHARVSDLCSRYNLSNLKVRKLLVTAGVYQSPSLTLVNGKLIDAAAEVIKLYGCGKSTNEIALELGLSRSTVNSLIPYSPGGAYNLEEKIDGSREMNNASLASRRNKRYRKKKIVEEFRKEEERKALESEHIDIDEALVKLKESKDMNKCACCGKETVNLVKVGNKDGIGRCCEHCAALILNEFDKRKIEGRDKDLKTSWIFNKNVYVNSSGEEISFPMMIFEVSGDNSTSHAFLVSAHDQGDQITYQAEEIYKLDKDGKKTRRNNSTEYFFSVFGPKKEEFSLLEDLVEKTAAGVKYRSLSKDGNSLEDVGMINVGFNEFIIDGKSYTFEELGGLFENKEGWRIQYQVMDMFSPVLEKDSYLMPVKLNDKTLMDELEEMICIFSKEGKGEFISRESLHGFEIYFTKLLDKLSFYYDHGSFGAGKIAGMKMIERLRCVGTDDDMFPEYQIKEIQDRISKYEWWNHPERAPLPN